MISTVAAGVCGAVLFAGAAQASDIKAPPSIAAEHEEIHEQLARAAAEAGELGEAARALERVLTPHFHRENELATPPLGLLRPLASGPPTAAMRDVLPTTRLLERELPQMLREHEAIGRARESFERAAAAAGRGEYVELARKLAAHAQQEEDVLYPAAVLVGRYVDALAPRE